MIMEQKNITIEWLGMFAHAYKLHCEECEECEKKKGK
jgi:hypothetical protein